MAGETNPFAPLWQALRGRGQKVDASTSFYMVRLTDDEFDLLATLASEFPEVEQSVEATEAYVVLFKAVEAIKASKKRFLRKGR